jgi:hypothetical protein
LSDEQAGQPQPDNVTAVTPEAVPQQAETQAPQVVVGGKYAGKTADELGRMLDEAQTHIGRQANELGDLRQQAQGYQNWLAQMQMQQAQQHPQTAQPQVPDEPPRFNWEDPERSVDARVERKLRTEMDAYRRQVLMETAASQAPIAKNIAKTMYPDAFKGISDQELDQAMFGGAAAGNVQPQNLTKPEAWRMLAWILQGEKMGYRAPAPGINPVSPTATETPVSAKPQTFGGEQNIALDDSARSVLKGFGIDEGEYLKNRRAERGGR